MEPRLSHADTTWDEECRSTNNRLPRVLLGARDGGKLFLCHYPFLLLLAVIPFISCRSLPAPKASDQWRRQLAPMVGGWSFDATKGRSRTLLRLADRLLLAAIFSANSVPRSRTEPARDQSLASALRHNMQGNIKRGDGVNSRPERTSFNIKSSSGGYCSLRRPVDLG